MRGPGLRDGGLVAADLLLPTPALHQRGHSFYIRWLLISLCARMMKKKVFSEKKIGVDYIFDAAKCLQQIEIPDLLHMRA